MSTTTLIQARINVETSQVLQEIENGEDLHSVADVDTFFDSFKK